MEILGLILVAMVTLVTKDVIHGQAVTSDKIRVLDSTLLRALNQETRRFLTKVVFREMNDTWVTIETQHPHVVECQKKYDSYYGDCLRCIQQKCNERRQFCLSRGVRSLLRGRSVSVWSDDIGVTVCSLVQESRQCQLIMNPEGTISRSISMMGDKLMIHFTHAVGDLGKTVVVNLISGMQQLVNNTEADPAIRRERERQLQLMMARVNTQLNNMGTQLSSSMSQLDTNLNTMLSGLGSQQQQMNNFWRDWGNRFSRLMNTFSTRLSSDLGNTFANMIRGKRRRKRQLSTGNRKAEVACPLVFTDESKCSLYMARCQGCDNITSFSIPTVCGQTLADTMNMLDTKLQKISTLYDDVVSSYDVISQVQYDHSSLDTTTLSYMKPNVTVTIGHATFTFTSTTPLKLTQLTFTAEGLAEEIWRHWLQMK